jgi:hypothetical protein
MATDPAPVPVLTICTASWTIAVNVAVTLALLFGEMVHVAAVPVQGAGPAGKR